MLLLRNRCTLVIFVLFSMSYSYGASADGGHSKVGLDSADADEATTTAEQPLPDNQSNSENTGVQGDVSQPIPELMGIANPTANISVDPAWVDSGQSVTLSWNTEAVTQCSASGNWLGSKAIAGSITHGPIFEDSSYTLSCEGEAGGAIAMATVRVRTAMLSWSQPTQNADGSALLDLDSYRLYVGAQSGIYDESYNFGIDYFRVIISLAPGQYYFAISSLDSENNESALSQEVSKLIE